MEEYSYYQDRNLFEYPDEEQAQTAQQFQYRHDESSLPGNLTLAGQFLDEWITNATDTEPGLYMAEKVFTAVFLFVFLIGTIIGNILVIMSVFTYRPLRSVQNFFIVSLAAADLAVAILVMPFNILYYVLEKWVFGIVFCDMWLTFDVMCCTASILNLCAIALDRYYAIHDPINYAQKRTLKRVLVMIALVWGLSAVISIPPIIGWNNWDDRLADIQDNRTLVCKLTDERGYVIYSASGSFYIPLIIMTVVYLRIFLATRRRLRQRRMRSSALTAAANNYTGPTNCEANDVDQEMHEVSSTETPDDQHTDETTHIKRSNGEHRHDKSRTPRPSKISLDIKGHDKTNKNQPKPLMHQFLEEKQKISLSKERRAARTLGIIMGVFILCWLPFFLMYIILPFCATCVPPNGRTESFIVWLGYVNSGLNPVIYTIFNIDFRRSFKRLLQGRRRGP